MKPVWECYGPYVITFRDAAGNVMQEIYSYFHSLTHAQQWAGSMRYSMDPRPVQWDARVATDAEKEKYR